MFSQNDFLIKTENLTKEFESKKSTILNFIGKRGNTRKKVVAVDNLNISIEPGKIFGLIGESGCGKTTTVRLILRLTSPTRGEILFDGKNISRIKDKKEMKKIRKDLQIIFQDPYESLSPHMTIRNILNEPLKIHQNFQSKETQERIEDILEKSGLAPVEEYLERYPHQLSGGQRQRVAIARALMNNPRFIAADEPTSMLDVSVRMGILNLLLYFKEEFKLTMLYITHDLATASYMCDEIGVMYNGKLVEMGPTKKILKRPTHPYTKALVTVVADLREFLANRHKYIKDGEPDLEAIDRGCIFSHRCPYAEGSCCTEEPPLREIDNKQFSCCHKIGSH